VKFYSEVINLQIFFACKAFFFIKQTIRGRGTGRGRLNYRERGEEGKGEAKGEEKERDARDL
jgi:hypothetical protein